MEPLLMVSLEVFVLTSEDKTPWYERDELWDRMGQIMFGEQRMEMAIAEVDRLIELLEISTDDEILDLCCGIGRHSNDVNILKTTSKLSSLTNSLMSICTNSVERPSFFAVPLAISR